MDTILIINADDLGHSEGINRGIEACHQNGVLTSASLMVNRAATRGGVEVARRNPALSVGLHFNVTDEAPEAVDLNDAAWIERELAHQFATFGQLMGRAPTHLDSHHHIHWNTVLTPLFQRFAAAHALPLRHYGPLGYEGGFYGQWEHGVTDLSHVSANYLAELIGGLSPGAWEIACHPGLLSPDLDSIYNIEREAEVRALTDPEVRASVIRCGARLVSFAGWRA